MEMAVFWVVAPCTPVEVYRPFSRACCLHHLGDYGGLVVLMMEAASTETSVNFYQTTPRNNPEDSHLRTHIRENLKSHNTKGF
jgi:hypothetical protein